jgi:hypothetical protein
MDSLNFWLKNKMRIVIELYKDKEKDRPIAAHLALETAKAMRQPVFIRVTEFDLNYPWDEKIKTVNVMPWHYEKEVLELLES